MSIASVESQIKETEETIASVESQIKETASNIEKVCKLLEKPEAEWTSMERQRFGNAEHLRGELTQLRGELTQLRGELTQLRREKELLLLERLNKLTPVPASIPPLFQVTSTLTGALKQKGSRHFVYKLAADCGAMYDTAPCHDEKGIYYDTNEPNNLCIKLLFSDLPTAAKFKNGLHLQAETMFSPLRGLQITAEVKRHDQLHTFESLRLVDITQYVPNESDSPIDTPAVSEDDNLSLIDAPSPLFKYQRIECDEAFVMTKAEKCHLIAKAYCKDHPSFEKYLKDENNLLALSHLSHGLFIGLNSDGMPLFKVTFVEATGRFHDNRHEVKVAVCALNASVACLFFRQLQKESVFVSDVERHVLVYVTDVNTFEYCLNRRAKETDDAWALSALDDE